MKKTVVWSCLLFLVASGSVSFAQSQLVKEGLEKGLENAAVRNLAKLQEITFKEFPLQRGSLMVSIIPEGAFEQNTYLTLRSIDVPTPSMLTESYLSMQNNMLNKLQKETRGLMNFTPEDAKNLIAHLWINGGKKAPHGKVFYTDSSQLARDLDTFYTFYKAKISETNTFKIYELPIDNILYKPFGAHIPEVLTAKTHFVMYNKETKTGQVVKRETFQQIDSRQNAGSAERNTKFPTPQQSLEELDRIAEQEYLEGETMDFSSVHRWATPEEEQELAWLNQAAEEKRFQELLDSGVGRLGTNEEIYLLKKMENEAGLEGNKAGEVAWEKMQAPRCFASQEHLGYFLQRLHRDTAAQVKDPISGHVFFVYEIPVDGLLYVKNDKPNIVLDPKEYVLLYNKREGARIIKRRMIEEERLYKFVQ